VKILVSTERGLWRGAEIALEGSSASDKCETVLDIWFRYLQSLQWRFVYSSGRIQFPSCRTTNLGVSTCPPGQVGKGWRTGHVRTPHHYVMVTASEISRSSTPLKARATRETPSGNRASLSMRTCFPNHDVFGREFSQNG
jgi:hypothetical protein